MTAGRNFPADFEAPAGTSFGALSVDRKGRLKLSPENNLDANEALVLNGDTVPVDGVNVTLAVSGSAVTGGTLPGTSLIVSDGDVIVVDTDSYTFTVVGGVITAIVVEPV